MSDIVSVYAVFADEDEAARIGRAMVERRLAACVNILGPCRSIFRWRGRLCEEKEAAALFKTGRAGTEALLAAIAELHSYETPALCVWPVEAAPPGYAQWIADETGVQP